MPVGSKSRWLFRVCLGLLAVALLVTGCGRQRIGGPGPTVQPGPAAPPPTAALPPPPPGTPPLPPLTPAPTGPAKPKVALLVPLSGPNEGLGRAMLDAAQLAVFDLADERFVLLPRDTGGTPETAAAAAEAALAEESALIIGPLLATETRAVADIARARGVPVLSFSNDRTVAGNDVFVLGLSPRQQVERVVAFARSRGLTRYAGLVPANPYGQAVEDGLAGAVARVEGQLVTIERYEAGIGDLDGAVRRLASQAPRRTQGAGGRIVGSGGFEALLVADWGERLQTIASLLPYHNIEPGADQGRVRLLGTALWEEPRTTRETMLGGAWFAAPALDARADFVRRFRETYGRDPARLATLAYDAVALASFLAKQSAVPDFSTAALTNPNGFAGMDGIFRLLPDGTTERGLAILEVRREGFETVSPAPTTFQLPTQ